MSCYLGISCSMNSSFVLLQWHLHPNQNTANDIKPCIKFAQEILLSDLLCSSISHSLLAGFKKSIVSRFTWFDLSKHGNNKPPIYPKYDITRKDLPPSHLILSPQSISLSYNRIFYRLLSVQHVTFEIISCWNRFQHYSQHRQCSSTAVGKGVTSPLNLHLITNLR